MSEAVVVGCGGKSNGWKLFDEFSATKVGVSCGTKSNNDLIAFDKIRYEITGTITIHGSGNSGAAMLSTQTYFCEMFSTGTSYSEDKQVPINILTEAFLTALRKDTSISIYAVSNFQCSSYYQYPGSYNAVGVFGVGDVNNFLKAVDLHVKIYVK